MEIERIMNGYWWRSSNSNNKGLCWLDWDKMCTPKVQDGQGFGNVYGFNITLLGKHMWNFIQKPNSLVTRIYKARYFHDCNILQATKGSSANFV